MIIPCEKCKLNPASALWNLITKQGKRKAMNLCASCGFSAPSWIRAFQPQDDEGNAVGDLQYYHPYVRAELAGKPIVIARAPTHPRMRASKQLSNIDSVLEG